MNLRETANREAKNRSRFSIPPSPSVTKAGAKPESQPLEALGEYMRPEGQRLQAAAKESDRPSSGEQLLQEWEIEEPLDTEVPPEDDIMQRLDRLEKRLDAFETTCYTFLLYAKRITDRTASFFEDIFGLNRQDLAQIHDRLGVNYNNRGDYTKAIEAFKRLVELQKSPASCFKLAVAYDNNGDVQEAIEAYRVSISLDTTYLRPYYKLADIYARIENFGEAVRCLTQAVEIDQNNAETHYRLGSIHSARGSYDQAIAAFNRVLRLAPDYPGIYQSLGLAYEQKGEHNKAIEFFKKSI